jgi:nitrite reductase/ring-hydroxylating ferredoxin subunit
VSPGLAFVGISILGTWGLASIGLIAGGVILLVSPGDPTTASGNVLGGVFLLVMGLVSGALMQLTLAPLLGIDPPIRIPAKSIIPAERLTKWASAGLLRDYPDGLPKEVRLRSRRVTIVRQGDQVYALNGLCSHARLPLAGIAGPVGPYPIIDGCVTCPFHGARFEVDTGRVARQPFTPDFNRQHRFLGGVQSKLFFWNNRAEDLQTYPVRIEAGEIMVALPR